MGFFPVLEKVDSFCDENLQSSAQAFFLWFISALFFCQRVFFCNTKEQMFKNDKLSVIITKNILSVLS